MRNNQKSSRKEQGKMSKIFTLRVDPDMLDAAKEKASFIGLPKIMRRLLELWLEGKIRLEDYDD